MKKYENILTKENLINLHFTQKLSSVQIGKLLNIHYSTIISYLKKYNIYSKSWIEHLQTINSSNGQRKFDSILTKEFLHEQYILQNKSPRQIARELHISQNTILKYLKRYKLFDINLSSKIKSLNFKDTCTNIYGVENISQLNYIKDKVKNTVKDRYGCDNVAQSDVIKEKMKETQYNKFGSWFLNTEKYLEKSKNTCLQKYGVENISQATFIKDKKYRTQKKNKSFNTSKYEELIYEKLKTIFKVVYREYKCDRYPFKCDFYIPSIDFFIEYNGNFTHGTKPFNKDNKEHQEILNYWKLKAQNSEYYKKAIYTWTISDVKKRNYFKKNKLKYCILCNMEQFNIVFNKIKAYRDLYS